MEEGKKTGNFIYKWMGSWRDGSADKERYLSPHLRTRVQFLKAMWLVEEKTPTSCPLTLYMNAYIYTKKINVIKVDRNTDQNRV